MSLKRWPSLSQSANVRDCLISRPVLVNTTLLMDEPVVSDTNDRIDNLLQKSLCVHVIFIQNMLRVSRFQIYRTQGHSVSETPQLSQTGSVGKKWHASVVY